MTKKIYEDFNLPAMNWTSRSSSVKNKFFFLIQPIDFACNKKISFQTAATGILDVILVKKTYKIPMVMYKNCAIHFVNWFE